MIDTPGLTSPDALTAVVGLAPAELEETAMMVRSIEMAPAEHEYGEFLQIVLGIGAVGLLLPVLVFVVTSTRLAAARREQRFAALRLVGATPSQVGILASMEAGVAAGAGTLLGFALFWIFRPLVARIPFTGHPFFTGDLRLGWMAIAGVLVGVPLIAAVASLVSLRRVNISPLGVTRHAIRPRPRAWRLVPVTVGFILLAAFGFIESAHAWTLLAVGLFALITIGLMVAGPWLTMIGSRLLVRLARSDSTLIAARRLGDDPGRGFRAISGLVLAVFVGTAFVAIVGTAIDYGEGTFRVRQLPPETVVQALYDQPEYSASASSSSLIEDLRGLDGVRAVVPVWAPVGTSEEEETVASIGLVAAEDWDRLGGQASVSGADGVVTVAMDSLVQGYVEEHGAPSLVAPGGHSASDRLGMVLVVTDGLQASIERVRTTLEVALPVVNPPYTIGELTESDGFLLTMLGRMVTVGVILCLIIAGCSLAVSVAGGLVERKRPLSLLRLSGMPLGHLYKAVILEAAVPLALAAVMSALAGFLVAALILSSTGGTEGFVLAAPGLSYYAMMIGGLLAALGVVCATLPLLGRLTEPLTVRME